MADSIVPINTLVAGKYRLTRLLGRGGMGSVWEGQHETLGTRVAVKFIDSQHANSAEARTRFANEAKAAASLRSKFVVEVYDHGVTEDGRPFIVMEYLEGEPLDRRLDRVRRLAPKDTAILLQQVCRALSKAHAAGIIHRDLKPENIFLVWDDEDGTDVPKVVDFGIAKFTDTALGPSSATRTGSVLGTPYYMSPEQARGLRSVDHRADLWSLGVIAYRAMTGTLPFDGEAIGDLLVKLCTAEVPLPSRIAPDLPPGFDAFIARALSRDVGQRFSTAQEFAASLCAVCGLSVRGAYGTGDVPMVSSGALQNGANSQSSVVTIANEGSPKFAATTGNPLVQTPPPVPAARSNRGLLLAGGIALGIAAAGGSALLLRGPAPTASSAKPAQATIAPLAVAVQTSLPASVAVPDPVVVPAPAVVPEPAVATNEPAASPPAAPAASAAAAPAPRRPDWKARPAAKSPSPSSKKGETDIGF